MKKTRIAIAIYSLISLIIVCLCALWLVNYIKRWALINCERTKISQAQQSINEYQRYGFDDTSELIALLQKRIRQSEQRIDHIAHTWITLKPQAPPSPITLTKIKNILALNKKMLISYITDLKEYRKLTISPSDTILKFAYDKVMRLTMAVAELERQLKEGLPNNHSDYIQRVGRMYQIHKESLRQYTNELHKLALDSTEQSHLKKEFITSQITDKIKTLNQLEKILDTY